MEKKPIQNYSKYTGMAFQLLSAILFGTLLGQWADGKMANKTPYLSALGALIGIGAGLYVSLKDFFKQNKKDGTS